MKKYLFFLLFVCSLLCTYTGHAQYWCWVKDTAISGEAGFSNGQATDLYGNVYCFATGKYLLKHRTSDGRTAWVKNNVGSSYWTGTKLATDVPGSVYLLYDTTAGYRIAKFDSSGNTQWTVAGNTAGGTAGGYTHAITQSISGSLYICGWYPEDFIVGADTLDAVAPFWNSFVTRFDTAGNLRWQKSVTSPQYARVISVATDRWDNVLIGGVCKSDTLKILDSTVYLGIGAGSEGIFVAKCDSTGHLLWVTASRHTNGIVTPSSGPSATYHIRTDSAGDVYFAGRYFETDTLGTIPIVSTPTDNVFLAKYRGSDGTVSWATTGGNSDYLFTLTVSPIGKSYLGFRGNGFTSTTHFGSTTFSSSTLLSQPGVVAGVDSTGNVVCGFMMPVIAEDGFGLTTDRQGNAYILGDYGGTTSFGGITLTATMLEEYFLAKYTCDCLCDGVLPLNGTNTMCVGNSITLTAPSSGGAWSSGSPSVATITPGGILTASSSGTTLISYTTGSGCAGAAVMTVNIGPTITSASLCAGLTTTLSASTPGGTWSSSSPGIANIGSSTGIVYGFATSGTTTISYHSGPGCISTSIVTVTIPSITGGGGICLGSTLSLGTGTPGGAWSSSSAAVATVGVTSGIVSGVAAGTTIISYIVPSSGSWCSSSIIVTVSAPSPPGSSVLCTGTSVMLTGSTPGGTWISSNTAVAAAGLSTGVVSAISAGTATISYLNPGGCTDLTNVTVNTAPGAIGGKLSICEGSNTMLTCNPLGGTWSSGSSAATISSSGLYTGVTTGTAMITYMLPGGCFSTAMVTVDPLPAVIVGPTTVTVGSSITLTNATAGGTWSSSDITKATVTSTGNVTGTMPGTVTIYYTLPTGCRASMVITIIKKNTMAIMGISKDPVKPSLYPNPAGSDITIKTESTEFTSFTIYNAAGQEVATHDLTSPEMKVNIKSLPPGQYQLIVRGDGVREVLPFVKR